MTNLKFLRKIATGLLSLSLILNFSTSAQAAEPAKTPAKKIVINSASRILSLYEGDQKIAIYPLGLGKVNTPTPTGYYSIKTKEKNPPWIDPSHPEYEVPSGPNNPLGYRWMQIHGNYGIHGTNRPESIGHYVSNGCIRMLEKNVEELFDKVTIGTPVEITYNRVVVEKIDDGNIVYYIYPDGYRWQSLNIDKVNSWLEPYGVAAFESDEEITKKIKNSDGQPTYLGKPYNIEVNGEKVQPAERNGRKFSDKAVVREKMTYLPAVPIAMTLKTKLEWHNDSSTLKTSLGEVKGYELKKQLYVSADDVGVLFGLDGGLENGIYKLNSFATKPVEPTEIIKTETPETPQFETPVIENPQPENPATEKTVTENPQPEKPAIEKTVTENKTVDDQNLQDGEVISTEIVEEVVNN